ncbi:MAG: DUF2007 domain-containing protein [Elusimicrobia bacterium]|nr:DUF2007 domain-containing protein [Elusimicrobiota bacterium]
MFCPNCGAEYREGFTRCTDCDIDLVETLSPGREPEEVKLCTVFITSSLVEANMVKCLLEGSGVKVFLYDANISRINPFYTNAVGGIKLVVRDKQVALTKEVLREYRGKNGADPFWGEGSALGSMRERLKPSEQAERGEEVVVGGKKLRCPNCRCICDSGSNFCDQCGERLS